MKIISSQQLKELDKYTIIHEPIASIDLMERAAHALTEAIIRRWDKSFEINICHLNFFAGLACRDEEFSHYICSRGQSCSQMGSPVPFMFARTDCQKCQRTNSSATLLGSCSFQHTSSNWLPSNPQLPSPKWVIPWLL